MSMIELKHVDDLTDMAVTQHILVIDLEQTCSLTQHKFVSDSV